VTSAPPVPAAFAPYLPPALADVNVPAYVLDRNGRICWLNAAALTVTGDAVGRPFTEVVDVEHHEARRIFEQNIAGRGRPDRTVSLVRVDGGTTVVQLSSVRLGSNHHAVGMFGLAVPERRRPRVPRAAGPLTPRQREVLELLGEGASTEAIAERLAISVQTVRNHIRQILQRLRVHSRLAAVAVARRDGLIA
jgi:DNA-binding CsgD family transcriptional regulator